MAATYDPSQPTAKDRVRRLMGDVAAPYKFQDEEIVYSLTTNGYLGDPAADAPPQPYAEEDAAISLLESAVIVSGAEQTIKTLSVTRTIKGASSGGFETILANLRARRNLRAAGAGISVALCYFPDLDPRNGYPDPSIPFGCAYGLD